MIPGNKSARPIRIGVLGSGVQPLASLRGEVVACRQGNMVATTFHPELTGDGRFHAWFIRLVRNALAAAVWNAKAPAVQAANLGS